MGTYMLKAAREDGMKFRLEWHWNNAAGDPYYALDSREDDYAWVAANARGELVSTLKFERDMREGIDDYRYGQTLARLLQQKPGHPAPATRLRTGRASCSATRWLRSSWATANSGGPNSEFRADRLRLAQAIERLAS